MKQNKNIITILLILFSVTLCAAQKIKVKKDKVLYNKQEVAMVVKPYRNHFVFSNLQGNKQFTVQLEGVSQNENNLYQYLILTNAEETITTDIPYEVLITSLKTERIIAYLLAKKYKLINEKGIDKDTLKNFFAKERESLSTKYTAVVAKEIAQENTRQQRIKEIKKAYNPTIHADGSIVFNQGLPHSRLAGRINYYDCAITNTKSCITIRDLDNILIAEMFRAQGPNNYKVLTYDGNQYMFTAARTYVPRDFAFAQEFILDLLARDYTLGHDAVIKNEELLRAKVINAAENSINIYGQKGYVTTNNGKTYKGIIDIDFEPLQIEQAGVPVSNQDLSNYGKTVMVTYVNSKGYEFKKSIQANEEAMFCVSNDNGEEDCFYGMETRGDALKKLQTIGGFGLNSANYYKLIHKEKGIMLLQDPTDTRKYVLKLTTEKKGQIIDYRSNKKLTKPISKYLKACKTLAEDIENQEFDLKIEENLIQIVKEYNRCTQ